MTVSENKMNKRMSVAKRDKEGAGNKELHEGDFYGCSVQTQ